MKPDLFSIAMFPTIPLNKEEKLDYLLDMFESNEKYIPSHWGNSEMIKVEYNRNEIIEKITSEGSISELYLHRDKTIKYSGRFDINRSPRSFLKFDFIKSLPPKMYPTFLELSNNIAQIVKPSFGVTHIFWPSSYPWNNERERLQVWMDICAYPIPVRFFPNGPLGIGARTYFSGHILEMFGKEFLLNCPGKVTELDWGGISIDVLENPLEADSDELLDSWLKIMRYLENSQVIAIPNFDDDRMGVSFSPNIKWKEYLKS